jgi:hypothetical protein
MSAAVNFHLISAIDPSLQFVLAAMSSDALLNYFHQISIVLDDDFNHCI